jgi:Tol biopolymer transport system component
MTKLYTLAVLVSLLACQHATVPEAYKYLKQTPPSLSPEVFAPNLISTAGEYEFGSVFNKDGTEFYYGVNVNGKEQIRYCKLVGDTWTAPETILSDEQFGYNDPFLSPDEKRLYCISQRPKNGQSEPKDYDIWYVERLGEGWSEPVNAGANINTEGDEYYISFTEEGRMYFSSGRDEGNFDIYTSDVQDGTFQPVVPLPEAINTQYYEADVFVAPDESYIIFCAIRPDGLGEGDLYVSFKQADGSWSQSKNMGEVINSEFHELCPFVSHDGKYLFYTSNKNIYWVDARAIDELR